MDLPDRYRQLNRAPVMPPLAVQTHTEIKQATIGGAGTAILQALQNAGLIRDVCS